LETLERNLRNLLDTSRSREKKLASLLEDAGIHVNLYDIEGGGFSAANSDCESMGVLDCPLEPNITFIQTLTERSGWLVGLLLFQSFSSFILANNEELIRAHPAIVFFLTMLVGAGGNAGNQAAVRVIRGLAVGSLTEQTTSHFIVRELIMAFALSTLIGAAGLLRAFFSAQTTLPETIAITVTLIIIVFVSIVTGALLPLLLQQLRVDPAHASTSIQVIMDISGVLLTCSISSFLLDTNIGKAMLVNIGVNGGSP
jgi:Mg/Co/Ni transporter MgtE